MGTESSHLENLRNVLLENLSIQKTRLTILAFVLPWISGCTVTGNGPNRFGQPSYVDDPCQIPASQYVGAAVGAMGLGVAAYLLGSQKAVPAIIAAAGGGTIGYLIGRDIDVWRCEQWKIAETANVTVRFDDAVVATSSNRAGSAAEAVGEVSTWAGDGHFELGSANLTPNAERYFSEIADTYAHPVNRTGDQLSPNEWETLTNKLIERPILIVGHTDDTGSSHGNSKLSEARARAVGKVFKNTGINTQRIFYYGAGESYPMADNRTPEGRAKNRRVEIVYLDSKAALVSYLRTRVPNLAYYRIADLGPRAPVDAAGKQASSTALQPAAQQMPQSSERHVANGLGSRSKNVESNQPPSVLEQPKRETSSHWIDFGGVQASRSPGVSEEMIGVHSNGRTSITRIFGVRPAAASDYVLDASCLADRPRVSGEVKRLVDDEILNYRTSEFLPGAYGSSYAASVNGHLVGMTNVAVLRDGAKQVGKSTLLVFEEYQGISDNSRKPDFTLSTQVNIYAGQDGFLYRVFVDREDTPIRCVDIVFPTKKPFKARFGKIYYDRRGEDYAADFMAVIAQ